MRKRKRERERERERERGNRKITFARAREGTCKKREGEELCVCAFFIGRRS